MDKEQEQYHTVNSSDTFELGMYHEDIEIDLVKLSKLSKLGLRIDDIADIFGLTLEVFKNILNRSHETNRVWIEGRGQMKQSIAYWQLDAAKRGNVQMLIWLGKQHLQQREVEKLKDVVAPLESNNLTDDEQEILDRFQNRKLTYDEE